MKKLFTLIAAALMSVGASATGEWSIDFATLGANYDDKTGVTISTTDVTTIGGTTMGTCTVAGEALNSNFVLQTGTTWLMRTTNGLYQSNGGGRSMGMLACTKGQIITIVGTGDPNPTTNATLKSSDAATKTYVYTVTADGDVKFTPARYLYFTSISVANPSATDVSYEVKYVDGNGNEIKTATEGSGEPGSAITVSEVEKASFVAEGKKYIYVSDDSEGKTISSEGTSVVTLTFREAATWNYTVNFVAGESTLGTKTGTVFEGDAAKVYFPRFILDEENKVLYQNKDAYEFSYSFTPTADNQVENIAFTAKETETNVVYYKEAEEMDGVTAYEDGFTQIRMSNGAVGIANLEGEAVKIASLTNGKYTIVSSSRSGNTQFSLDSEDLFTLSSTGAVVINDPVEFTVKEESNIYAFNEAVANNSNYFDYVLIRRTGDYNYLELEQNLPDTLKYVKGTAEDEKPNITDYIKVNTNASQEQLGAVFYVAKVEAGADKTTAEYTMYTTEEASKLAMSEAGLYYAFGRVAAMFSATEILQAFTDTIVVEVSEPVVPAHTWSFTNWSDATIANLKADAAASKTSGWSDVEKKADAEADADPTELSKDNCFWFAGEANADGQLEANGVVIEELKGLTFPTAAYNSARSIAIAVNYQLANADLTKAFGPYDGASYFWLGGKEKDCFVINNVKVGTEIKMGVESHKITDARGVKLYVKNGESRVELKGTDGEAVAAPTTYADQTWVVTSGAATAKGTSLSANVAAEELVDVIVYNTNGCHIYYIDAEIGEATPTAIEAVAETVAENSVKKFIVNGKLVIVNGNAKYNAAGAQVK